MAIKITNPLRAVWAYMRGDDLKAPGEQAAARAQAARAALLVSDPPATAAAMGASGPVAPAPAAVAAEGRQARL